MQSNPKLRESLGQIGVKSADDLRARRVEFPFLERHESLVETLDQPALHYLAGQTAFVSDSNQELRFVPPGPVHIKDHSLTK